MTNTLKNRQEEVLNLLKEGLNLTEIANRLYVSRQYIAQLTGSMDEYVCSKCKSKHILRYINGQFFCINHRPKPPKPPKFERKPYHPEIEGWLIGTKAEKILGIDSENIKQWAKRGILDYQLVTKAKVWYYKTEQIVQLKERIDMGAKITGLTKKHPIWILKALDKMSKDTLDKNK